MVDNDGVLTEEALELLEKTEVSLKEKSTNICKVLKNFESDEKALQDEIDRLAKKKKSISNNKEKLKNWLWINLEKQGIDKLEAGTFTLSFRKSESVDGNIEEVPTEYLKTTVSLDKTSLKKALKEGADVPWAYIVEKMNLQIK